MRNDIVDDNFEPPELQEIDASWSLDRLNDYRKYLQSVLLRLQEETGIIRNQLNSAQQQAVMTGQYANRSWWRRANDALQYKKSYLQATQMALGETNRQIKQTQHTINEGSQDHAFVKTARRMLPTDLFMEILKASREE